MYFCRVQQETYVCTYNPTCQFNNNPFLGKFLIALEWKRLDYFMTIWYI
jgi:hypothetical protein